MKKTQKIIQSEKQDKRENRGNNGKYADSWSRYSERSALGEIRRLSFKSDKAGTRCGFKKNHNGHIQLTQKARGLQARACVRRERT